MHRSMLLYSKAEQSLFPFISNTAPFFTFTLVFFPSAWATVSILQ